MNIYDKRNGKGKEYYYNGRIKFEGEYLNNKKLIGKEYEQNRNIIYKLNYIIGKGKEFVRHANRTKLLYEGEYLNGEHHRKRKEYDRYTVQLE